MEEKLDILIPEWKYENERLRRDFKFKDFIHTFAFMSAIALKAEKLDHHPNWKNAYNILEIELYTHSEGKVTSKDVELAQYIDALYLS